MSMKTNIDDVRAEIIRLEAALHFDADAWSRVLADLGTAGRFSALTDAQRRKETARSNQPVVIDARRELVGFMCFHCLPFRPLSASKVIPVKGPPNEAFVCPACVESVTPIYEGTTGDFYLQVKREERAGVAVETGYNADGRLKAYWVQCRDDEWGMWIHAESAGKAKSIYHQQDPSLEPANFTDLRAIRPWHGAETLLDITPFTDGTLALAGYPVNADEFPDAFLEFCPCSMCKAERLKPTYRMIINDLVEA